LKAVFRAGDSLILDGSALSTAASAQRDDDANDGVFGGAADDVFCGDVCGASWL